MERLLWDTDPTCQICDRHKSSRKEEAQDGDDANDRHVPRICLRQTDADSGDLPADPGPDQRASLGWRSHRNHRATVRTEASCGWQCCSTTVTKHCHNDPLTIMLNIRVQGRASSVGAIAPLPGPQQALLPLVRVFEVLARCVGP